MLPDAIRPRLHEYMAGILRGRNSPAVEINTMPDHAHVLFLLGRSEPLSEVVGNLKQSSTLWLREQVDGLGAFHWQNGYGAFSVSQSGVDEVREYIREQKAHHRQMSFQDEFRLILRKYEIEWDERYVWD